MDILQTLKRMLGVPSVQQTVLAATSTPSDGAPESETSGVSCRGIGKVDLTFTFSAAAETATVRLWLMDGDDNWQHYVTDKEVSAAAGQTRVCIDPFDTGSFNRIAVELITAPTTGTLRVQTSPKAPSE